VKKLTKAQQKELAEIMAELAKELRISRSELFSRINEKAVQAGELHPERN
jgi:hypothetical protein